MKIVIATDAWLPQVNGVVRTLEMTVKLLRERGHDVTVISPDQFRTIPCPGYGEIRLAIAPRVGMRRALPGSARYCPHFDRGTDRLERPTLVPGA